ncbi:MAG: restriction endonuclease subunit S [Paludibacteraceae bacterium]
MNKLQQLIQQLCPNGVEYKKMGDLGVFENIGVDKKIVAGQPLVTLLNYVDVYKNMYIDNKIPQMVVSATEKKIQSCSCEKGDIFITPTSETRDDIGHASVIVENLINTVYSYHIMRFRLTKANMITSFFIRYLFETDIVQKQICKLAKGLTRFGLSKYDFAKIEIPLPPLEVQEEIVRILDKFSLLSAELEAELEFRKKQYDFYRNRLLSFDSYSVSNTDESSSTGTFTNKGYYPLLVKWKKLGEIGKIIRGKRFVKTDIVNNGVPCIHYGDMYTYYGLYATQSKGRLRNELASKMRYAQKNDVVIVAAGENKEDIGIGLAWLGDEPAAVHDACFIFRSDLYPQYVSHYLRSNYYHKQIVKYVSEGKICSISAKGLGNAIIPIPAYEEQVRIATLLNNYEALVNDLSQGLPAEITAVQQQYEYYRNKLLTFPRNNIA